MLWLNFCPERLVNALAEGHPASALRTDGSLRSDCWELVHLSLGECFWLCCKLNIWPFAFPYGGKPTDVYSKENIALIEAAYAKFVRTVFSLSLKNVLGSKAVLEQVHKLFGGKIYFDTFHKTAKSHFFSLEGDEFETSVHPECFLNRLFINIHTGGYAVGWDCMYTKVKVHVSGILSAVCTTAMEIFNREASSPAY